MRDRYEILFDLTKRMAELLRDYGRGDGSDAVLDICCEFDAIDAAFDKAEWARVHAPCQVCGYNGPGYYQPKAHPCAGNPNYDPRWDREQALSNKVDPKPSDEAIGPPVYCEAYVANLRAQLAAERERAENAMEALSLAVAEGASQKARGELAEARVRELGAELAHGIFAARAVLVNAKAKAVAERDAAQESARMMQDRVARLVRLEAEAMALRAALEKVAYAVNHNMIQGDFILTLREIARAALQEDKPND